MRRFIDIYKNLSEGPKKVLHNMNWLFFDVVLRVWISFFVWTWLARYFWPLNFWIYNYALAFVWIFWFIANLWLDGITIKELVDKHEKKDEILGSVFFLKLIWSIIAIIIINLLSYFLFYKSQIQTLTIFIISLWFVFQTFNVINLYFQSKVEWKYNVIASWSWFLVSNILKLVIIFNWLGVVYLSAIYLIDFIIWSWVWIYIYYKYARHNIFNWSINRLIVKKMFIRWLPLALSSIANYIFLRIDQLMIWNMMTSREVWLYSVSVIISDSTLNFFWIVWPSLFPALIASKKISLDVYMRRLKMYYSLFSIIWFWLVLPIYLLSDQIILILFWDNYIESIIVLKIYIWSVIATAIMIPLHQHMINEKVISYSLYSISAWAWLSVIMNYFLIPKFWLTWAAYSTTIPAFFSLFIFLFFKKTRSIFIFWLKSFNPLILLKIIHKKI
ncbi:MAG: putative polysaccharide biosynthesis protein [uncultured bacterium (gcode 4)]|uniref:Putative polysaccharide biosynthesis protein n=1 Tax=uncultured bacterium (gcode 4) TaxID=1234023 RepID=K2G203_9BACT|nr:MAG: putative polysaccharide biosynthesis protein [uncultured bacterium (gcode 4)]